MQTQIRGGMQRLARSSREKLSGPDHGSACGGRRQRGLLPDVCNFRASVGAPSSRHWAAGTVTLMAAEEREQSQKGMGLSIT